MEFLGFINLVDFFTQLLTDGRVGDVFDQVDTLL